MVAIALVTVALLTILRPQRPEMAVFLSLAVGIAILLLVLGRLGAVVQLLQQMALKANVNFEYLNLVLKIVGVAYLAELGAQVARDAGEGALAAKVELAGKVIILALAVPIFSAVMELVLRLLA